jgi:flagellar hook-basal body complex protein FliE
MSLAIPLLSHLGHLAVNAVTSPGPALAGATAANEFGSLLESAVQKVNQPQIDASQSVQRFLTGQGEELHNVALATQRAAVAFDLGLQVRNRVVAAYQEVMKIQL